MTTGHAVLIALAIVAHGWAVRIQGPSRLMSTIGWTLNILAIALVLVEIARRGAP
jgi:hypothetical protein